METTHTLILNTTLLFILRKFLMNIFLTIPLQLKTFNKATGYCICQFQQQKPYQNRFLISLFLHLCTCPVMPSSSVHQFVHSLSNLPSNKPKLPLDHPPTHPYSHILINSLIILLRTCIDSLIPFLSEVS